jgi:transposase InsO family protein
MCRSSHVSEVFNTLLRELPQQPSIVQTDKGGEYSAVFDEASAEHIKHERSEPGHPQTNSAVEILNRTLSDKLKERYANQTANGVPWNFPGDLRQILENYNRTVHSSTGMQPVELLAETDADVLKMVRQHVSRQRQVEGDVDDCKEFQIPTSS